MLSAHRLRATFATLQANVLGTPLPVVQQLMRHKDIKTTMGYIEGDQVLLDDAQRKYEASFRAQARASTEAAEQDEERPSA